MFSSSDKHWPDKPTSKHAILNVMMYTDDSHYHQLTEEFFDGYESAFRDIQQTSLKPVDTTRVEKEMEDFMSRNDRAEVACLNRRISEKLEEETTEKTFSTVGDDFLSNMSSMHSLCSKISLDDSISQLSQIKLSDFSDSKRNLMNPAA